MIEMSDQQQQTNTLGNASLGLGIASLALVFGIGFCALVGSVQGWLPVLGTVLYVCGASSAFLGFLGFVLGFAGLIGAKRSRATAVVGLLFGVGGICLFLSILAAIGGS
jgi:hypothetical protein